MIKVLKAGFFASIQDKGRIGFAAVGIPVSGVMDRYAADIANSILNNPLEDAVLEITLGGIELQFLFDTFICLSGGDFSPQINGKPILMNSRINVLKNDILSFGKVSYGVRCYLSVKGGIQTEKVLKSRSFYKGITETSVIKKNTIFSIKETANEKVFANASVKILKSHFTTKEIQCIKGPEFYLLNEIQKKKLTQQVFTISNDNSRMGYRLNELFSNELPSILTSAVLSGTVQLTPSGKLIILMRDCQVTGGYPRILQLTSNAINQLAQKTTNSEIQFIL